MNLTLGIDIGGTKTAFGLVDASGVAHVTSRTATQPNRSVVELVAEVARQVEVWLERHPQWRVWSVGVGCAGPVDAERGTIENPDTLPQWMGAPVVQLLRERLGVERVVLDNDANAAAIAEARLGPNDAPPSLMMLTFGTGVGGAFVHQGAPFRGIAGAHPEFGLTPVAVEAPAGVRVGTLEAFASGEGIRRCAGDRGLLVASAGDIFVMADSGHPVAQEVIGWAMQATAWAAWTLAHSYLPHTLVLGGGVATKQSARYLGAVGDGLRKARLVPSDQIELRMANGGEDAGLLGAAALAFD